MGIWPPPPPTGETDVEKADRLEQARFAKKRSDEIDQAIEVERRERQMRGRRSPRKVLLLGQSESGKSTLLKNFQLQFAPRAFSVEAEAWRPVIYLNLVRSVLYILDFLSNSVGQVTVRRPGSFYGPVKTDDKLRHVRLCLSPLRQVEIILAKCLSVDKSTKQSSMENNRERWLGRTSGLRGGSAWKSLANLQGPACPVMGELHNARYIVEACHEEVIALWANPYVRTALQDHKITLEDQSGFFLDQAGRLTSNDYVPTPEDILRARLETVGVEEHRVIMETGMPITLVPQLSDTEGSAGDTGQEWIFYDIEGTRGRRGECAYHVGKKPAHKAQAAWVPYFDDVNAIIFLCSMSSFDQSLPEAPGINCFSDSFSLWKTICENKLLAHAAFILFLNKYDLLDAKLKSGIFFGEYVSEYKDKPNDTKSVVQYVRNSFIAVHKHYTPRTKRPLSVHTTCAIDTNAMSVVLRKVKESILVSALEDVDLM